MKKAKSKKQKAKSKKQSVEFFLRFPECLTGIFSYKFDDSHFLAFRF